VTSGPGTESAPAGGSEPTGQAPAAPIPPVRPRRRRRSAPPWRRLLGLLLIGSLLTAAGLWATIWLQELPLHRAEWALADGRVEAARGLVEDFLRGQPDHEAAHRLRARILVKQGRWDDVITIYENYGAATRDDLRALSTALLREQKFSFALPVLEALLKASPDDPDLLHETTACRSFLGKHQAALESAERLARIPGHEVRGLIQSGMIQESLGNHDEAIAAWAGVVRSDPQLEQIQLPPEQFLARYGESLLNAGRAAEAIPWLERSIDVRPTPEALTMLGECREQTGEPEAAARAWEQAVAMQPRNEHARHGLAELALGRRDLDAARRWIEPLAARSQPTSAAAYLMQRIETLEGNAVEAERWRAETARLRELERKRNALHQLLVDAPESFWARAYRAYRFAEEGNWEEAGVILSSLQSGEKKNAFVEELLEAVRRRRALPPIERFPTK